MRPAPPGRRSRRSVRGAECPPCPTIGQVHREGLAFADFFDGVALRCASPRFFFCHGLPFSNLSVAVSPSTALTVGYMSTTDAMSDPLAAVARCGADCAGCSVVCGAVAGWCGGDCSESALASFGSVGVCGVAGGNAADCLAANTRVATATAIVAAVAEPSAWPHPSGPSGVQPSRLADPGDADQRSHRSKRAARGEHHQRRRASPAVSVPAARTPDATSATVDARCGRPVTPAIAQAAVAAAAVVVPRGWRPRATAQLDPGHVRRGHHRPSAG